MNVTTSTILMLRHPPTLGMTQHLDKTVDLRVDLLVIETAQLHGKLHIQSLLSRHDPVWVRFLAHQCALDVREKSQNLVRVVTHAQETARKLCPDHARASLTGRLPSATAVASWPHAPSISEPRVSRIDVAMPLSRRRLTNAS